MKNGSHCPLCPREHHGALAPESPGVWRAPRVVCHAHAADAVLVNGRRLIDVLRAARSLDSPGLVYVINPVRVGGLTAWVTFAAGGWRLLAEPGSDAFDAQVRNDPYWLDTLWLIATHETSLDGDSGAAALASFSAVAGPEALERMLALVDHARRHERYRDALQRLGKPCVDSVDEANAISVAVEPLLASEPPEALDDLLARIRALVRLAISRFAGTAETWALDFVCDLSMATLRARLAEQSGWLWARRDSDRLGEYTSAYHSGMMFKLYDEHGSGNGPSYTLAIARTRYCGRDRESVESVARALLSSVGGRDVRPGDIGDWR